ncbi:MAG: glycosyltransferase family 2 protein, partial [Acidimicrobiales bacterium]
NRLLSLVTSLLYARKVSDMETCYKLFDRRVIEPIHVISNRFDFEPEITAKVLRQGFDILEVPINYAGRDFADGKKITWRDGFAAVRALVRFRFTKSL